LAITGEVHEEDLLARDELAAMPSVVADLSLLAAAGVGTAVRVSDIVERVRPGSGATYAR